MIKTIIKFQTTLIDFLEEVLFKSSFDLNNNLLQDSFSFRCFTALPAKLIFRGLIDKFTFNDFSNKPFLLFVTQANKFLIFYKNF